MQIQTIQTRFEAIECKFESFQGILTIQMQILTSPTRFEAIECKFESFERDSNHSKAKAKHSNDIRKRMHIETIRMRFQAIECKFMQIRTIQKGF